MSSGHVAKKGKNWYVVLELETEDGERNRRWISAKKELGLAKRPTKTQAEELLGKYLRDLSDGLYVEPTDITVKEYLEQWLEDYALPNLKPTTYGSYKNTIKVHIIPKLGHIKLSRLRKAMIKGFLAEKQKDGARADSRPGTLSNRTVQYMYTILKAALKHAVEDELIRSNPATGITAPKPARPKIDYWEQEQAKAFLDKLKEEKHKRYPLFLLALTTGMRRGEVLGLTWQHVNFEKRTIRVSGTYVHTASGDVMQNSTKGGKDRIIELAEGVIKELREHHKQQMQELEAMQGTGKNEGFVFTTTNGTPIAPRNLDRQLKILVSRYDMPPWPSTACAIRRQPGCWKAVWILKRLRRFLAMQMHPSCSMFTPTLRPK